MRYVLDRANRRYYREVNPEHSPPALACSLDSEDPQSIEGSRTETTGLNLAQNGSISLELPLELKTLAFLVSSSLPSSSI